MKKIFNVGKKFEFPNLCPWAQAVDVGTTMGKGLQMLKRYVIERDIPGIGQFSPTELCGAARASNAALAKVGPSIQWQHSYIGGDKTFCIYLAESEDDIRRHSVLSGIPVGKITETPMIIDPTTANN